MAEANIQLIGFGRRVFPANFYALKILGNDVLCEFIFDDDSKEPAIALALLVSPVSVREMILKAEKLMEKIDEEKDAAPVSQKRQPVRWSSEKVLELDQAPLRASVAAFARILDVITLSFAYVHPNTMGKVPQGAEKTTIPLNVQAEVSLEFSQFTGWLEDLKSCLQKLNPQ